MEKDRKKEVINVCLDHFISNGLSETTTRSLSSALKLQNAGLYFYFANKDEAVILCAEEAALRLENCLIAPAMRELSDPDALMKRLRSRADEMAPTMRFFISVCVSNQYKDAMKPALDRLSERYEHYVAMFADKLKCDVDVIAPYMYIGITAVTNYMIFAEEAYILPQIDMIKARLIELQSKSSQREER